MTLRTKRFLLLFVPTFLFLTFFSGFYFYLYFNYLNDSYEWYVFEGGQPSDLEMIFMGFRNFQDMFFSIVISTLFSFLGGGFLKSQIEQSGKRRIVLNGIILTLFLSGLYLLYKLIVVFVLGWSLDYWEEIKQSVLIMIVCYFIIAIPLTYLFFRQNNEELQGN